MEETVSARQFPGPLLDPRTLRYSDPEAIEVFGMRNPSFCPSCLGTEVRSNKQIGAQLFSHSGLALAHHVPSGGLAFSVGERFLRHGVDFGGGIRYFDHAGFVEQAAHHDIANLAVPFLDCPAGGPLIPCQILVRLSGYAACDHLGIEQTHQTVAVLDVSVEEGQWLAGLDGLDPERGLAQLHREWVPVDPMDTMLHDLAQRVLSNGLVGGVHPGLDAGDLGGHAACRCQQKVSGATCRVEHLEIEDGFAGIFWASRDRLGEDGFKRRLDEFFHQGRRRVVRPGELSLGALGLITILLACEAE